MAVQLLSFCTFSRRVFDFQMRVRSHTYPLKLAELLFIPEIAASKQIHVWRPTIEPHSRLGIPFVCAVREYSTNIRSFFMFLLWSCFYMCQTLAPRVCTLSFNFTRVEARVLCSYTLIQTIVNLMKGEGSSLIIMFELKNVLFFYRQYYIDIPS